MDELSGQTLHQRYQIQSQLSRKVGRRTFLAIDLQTDMLVVIKLLIFNQDFDWQDLKLFEREAETLKSIEHPAIPRYLDYFEFDLPEYRGFALVQDYINAKSLDLALSKGRRWSEDDVRQIAQALLKILEYLHSQNPPIVHRDIKPSNILITNRSSHHVGDIYLVDFGSVQNLGHRDGSTMTIVGTYGYMPPEQFGGKAFPSSDLYSLGATLIYLVTGNHPADLTGDDGKIHFKSDHISKGLIDWLEYLTQPTIDRRFKNVSDAQILIGTRYIPPLSVNQPLTLISSRVINEGIPNLGIIGLMANTLLAFCLTATVMISVIYFVVSFTLVTHAMFSGSSLLFIFFCTLFLFSWFLTQFTKNN